MMEDQHSDCLIVEEGAKIKTSEILVEFEVSEHLWIISGGNWSEQSACTSAMKWPMPLY